MSEKRKYQAGDKVTILLDSRDAVNLNADLNGCYWNPSQIIAHEPAPFDWKDVKPGMAFTRQNGQIVWYVADDFSNPNFVVIAKEYEEGVGVSACTYELKEYLTRAPEHDIGQP